MSSAYTYQGLRSPFQWYADGDVAKMTDKELIDHSLQVICETKEWTRPGALRVGSGVPDSVFSPNDITEQIAIDTSFRSAVARLEPRCSVIDVTFQTIEDDETIPLYTLRMKIWYRIVSTGAEDMFSYDLKEAAA